jgi:predicted DsbA family dithiol-disulfide isomerase
MDIEIWSDITCPFCYIGKRKFEIGLKKFAHRDQCNVIFRSFQLDPFSKKGEAQYSTDVVAKHFGISREKAKEINQQVADQAKEAGLDYQFEAALITNTEDAHRLIQFAKEHGKKEAMLERLFSAFFTEGKHIGDHDTLILLAEDVGLNKEAVRNLLNGDQYRDAVQAEIQEGKRIGVQGVPLFVFNRKFAVSGAQSPETFLKILEQTWAEENASSIQVVQSGNSCTGDSCNLNLNSED